MNEEYADFTSSGGCFEPAQKVSGFTKSWDSELSCRPLKNKPELKNL